MTATRSQKSRRRINGKSTERGDAGFAVADFADGCGFHRPFPLAGKPEIISRAVKASDRETKKLSPSVSQQASVPAPTSSPQAATLLTQSATALAGNVALSDVTLSGTARRIAGSDDDTGTAVFKALASGASRMDLSLSSGQRSEVCDFPATTPTGTWLGPDRISHPIAFHNLVRSSSPDRG